MAGYIGSKAVTLSTTAADVAGNAVIDGDLTVKGTTVTIDSAAVQEIRLGDNDKMTFGDATGGDLQIYHDGSKSLIEETGTGSLTVRGTNITFQNGVATSTYANFVEGAEVSLRYNNSTKLATTSTGVDITGTLTSDGLTVDGGSVNNDSNAIAAKINANGNEHIRLEISTNSTIGNQAALDLISNSNTSRIYTTGTSGLTFSTDGGSTAHLTVDGSGNVGIGGAASSFGSGVATLQLKGLASGKTAAVTFRDNGGTDVASIFAQNDATYGLSIGTLGATGDFVRFHTGALGTERMRIDSSGNFLLGKTSVSWTLDGTQIENGGETLGVTSSLTGNNFFARKNNATGTMFAFWYNNTNIGNITSGTSSVSYNTSSDHRLKENVVELTGATDRLKQLEPKRFNFIADPDTTVDGFLAHEAQAVVPEAVTGTHNEVDDDGNAVMQGIDQSKLVPLLTAALQEAIAKIETLETEMTSVKARLDALEGN